MNNTKKKNKVAVAVATAVLSTAMAATACTSVSAATTSETKSSSNSTNAVSYYRICGENIEKAENIAGFDFNLPQYSNYSAVAKEGLIVVEVPINSAQVFSVEKSTQSYNYSSSCEYEYTDAEDKRLSELSVKFGTENNKIYKAVWNDNGTNYAVTYSDGADSETVTKTVAEIANLNK